MDDDDQVPLGNMDNVSDNVDLYEDLDLFRSTRSVTECSLSYAELQEKLREKEMQLSTLKLEVKQLGEQNICLRKNISCLFRTAKNELQNKDQQINLLQTRLLKKPGKKARKKKTSKLNTVPVVNASDQPRNLNTTEGNNTVSTNDTINSTNSETIRTPVTLSPHTTHNDDQLVSCTAATPNDTGVVTSVNKTVGDRSSNNRTNNEIIRIPETACQNTTDKDQLISATAATPNNTHVVTSFDASMVSNDISLAGENSKAVNVINNSGEELLNNDMPVSTPVVDALVEVESVHDNVDTCVNDADEARSISDGEIVSDGDEGDPPTTKSYDNHHGAKCDGTVLSHQATHRTSSQSHHQGDRQRDQHDQPSRRHSETITPGLQKPPGNQDKRNTSRVHHSQHHTHHDDHKDPPRRCHSTSEPQSGGLRDCSKRLHHSVSESDPSRKPHHKSSELPDSSKRLDHTSSRSHDPLKSRDNSNGLQDSLLHITGRSYDSSHHTHDSHRTSRRQHDSLKTSHRTPSGSHDSSRRLHHNSSGSHDSKSHCVSHYASSGSHEHSERLHHRSFTGSHDSKSPHVASRSERPDSKSHNVSSGSRDSSKSMHHQTSNRSHDPLHNTSSSSHNSSQKLHHTSSGSHDSKSRHVASRSCDTSRRTSSGSHDPHNSSLHSSNGPQNSSRTRSLHCSQHNSPVESKPKDYSTGTVRGSKRQCHDHDRPRAKRNRSSDNTGL